MKKPRTKKSPAPPPIKSNGTGPASEIPEDPAAAIVPPPPSYQEAETGESTAVLRRRAERIADALTITDALFGQAIQAHADEKDEGRIGDAIAYLFGRVLEKDGWLVYSPAAGRYLPGPLLLGYRRKKTPDAHPTALVIPFVTRARRS